MTESVLTIDDAYLSVKGMIYSLAKRFNNQYGGEFDDIIGEANLIFVTAYKKFDASRGALTTWIYCKVWHGLVGKARRYAKEAKKATEYAEVKRVDENLRQQGCVRPNTFLLEFMDSVSKEAREIITLALDMPDDVVQLAIQYGGQPRNARDAIKRHFYEEAGWTWRQVRASFNEIKEVLKR